MTTKLATPEKVHQSMPPKKILFALIPRVRRDFLPDFDSSPYHGVEIHDVDPSSLSLGEWESLLQRLDPEIIVTGWQTSALPESFIEQGGSLKYVCHLCGSVRDLLPRTMIENGLLVSNWGPTISHTIAEHAILLVLGSLRNIPLWKEGFSDWNARPVIRTRSLRGKKVGVHGFGNIAREITLLLKPFGVQISAYSRGVPSDFFIRHGVIEKQSLEELFSSSDILIECEGLTPETTGIISREILELLPRDAVFVNVGRGALADEEALAAAAETGRIRVASDVYIKEPPAKDSPLRKIPQTFLSPHIAGPTHDALPLCGDFGMQNLRHYLAGEIDRIEGKVTLSVYDRST